MRVPLQLEERRRDLALFKSGNGQQAQRLRYAPAEIRRCVCRREGAVSNDGGPEEDWSAGAGRDHRANTHCPRRMVGCSWRRKGPISVSRPLSTTAAPLDCAACPHRPSMGGVCRPQWVGLRRTHSLRRNEAAQIYRKTGNLRAGAAALRTHETGKALSAISGSGGRCPRHLGTGQAIGERDEKGRAGEQAKHARLLGDGRA